MNVRPAHYAWDEFYALNVDLVRYAWSGERVWNRLRANTGFTTKALNFIRATSSKRISYQSEIRRLIGADPSVHRYVHGESAQLPDVYRARIEKSLGPLWDALPAGAVDHDPYAYIKGQSTAAAA